MTQEEEQEIKELLETAQGQSPLTFDIKVGDAKKYRVLLRGVVQFQAATPAEIIAYLTGFVMAP